MEDFIVKAFSESFSELGKGSFTRDICYGKSGIGTVPPAFIVITEVFPKLANCRISIKMSKQINEKKSWRIIAWRPKFGVAVGGKGTDKTEVDERSDHSRQTALNGAIGANFHEFFLEVVMG